MPSRLSGLLGLLMTSMDLKGNLYENYLTIVRYVASIICILHIVRWDYNNFMYVKLQEKRSLHNVAFAFNFIRHSSVPALGL